MTPEVQALIDKAHASPQAARLLHTQGFSDFAASQSEEALRWAEELLAASEAKLA